MGPGFHRNYAMSLWGITVCAAALSWPPASLSSPVVFAVLGLVMMVTARWIGTPLRVVGVLQPARFRVWRAATGTVAVGKRRRASESAARKRTEALNLIRMDEDAGWPSAGRASSGPGVRQAYGIDDARG
jgi:hypothetical protein